MATYKSIHTGEKIDQVVGDFDTHVHEVIIENPSAQSASKVTGNGTVTAGEKPTFTQGTDSFTQNTPTVIDTSKFNGGTPTTVTDSTWSFTVNENDEELIISGNNGSHSNGSAASLGTGFYTAGTKATFTQGTDSFTQGKPTSVTLPTFTTVGDLWSGTEAIGTTNSVVPLDNYDGAVI